MSMIRLLLATTLASLLFGCASTPTARRVASPHGTARTPEVLLISLDGYRADYLARGDNPVLERLAAAGVRARWLIPSFPTVTEPNHYTFLTGLYPDHNGIVGNYIKDRGVQRQRFSLNNTRSMINPRWWSEATPLWVSAQRQGIRTAELSWPDGFVKVDGMRPDLHHNGPGIGSPAQETTELLRWLDLPANRRPRFIMVHYELIDATGHRYGPDSRQLDTALRTVDAALGRLVHALKKKHRFHHTDLVIVSDHGMAALSPKQRVYLDDMIDMHAVSAVSLGAGANIDPHRTAAGKSAASILLAPHPHLHCWRKHQLPKHLHYGSNPRIAAIVCLATPGWLVTTHAAEARREKPLRGDHGYDNLAPSMRALFIAEGPLFRKEYVSAPFPNVDIYPLLAHLLHIRPEPNDGHFAQVASLLEPTRH